MSPEHDTTPQSRWQRQQDCAYSHTRKRDDIWRRGEDEDFELLQASNGRISFHLRCRHCGFRCSALPTRLVKQWGLSLNDVQHVQINPGRVYDPCSVSRCEETPTEYHHFAPCNTFEDAWDWPCLPLCRPHHLEWHRRMDGYRWHAKRAA